MCIANDQFNIFEKEIIIFPINLNNMHWVAAAVYLKEKRVDYFDSMGTHGPDKDRVFQVSQLYRAFLRNS